MKILLIGDQHFKPSLGYSDYISDKRVSEKNDVLNQIKYISRDCDAIVFMGDNLDKRNNTSIVLKEFVDFVESFPAEKVFIISGNHERLGDGTTAIDFLGPINRPWHIITNAITNHIVNGVSMTFIPYMTKIDWNVQTDQEAAEKMVGCLSKTDIVIAHHALTNDSFKGVETDTFNEIVLDADTVFKYTDVVCIGHLHDPKLETKVVDGVEKKFLKTGSLFTNEVNEKYKSVWTVDIGNGPTDIVEHKIKQRGIYKLINPSIADLDKIDLFNIVKAFVTDNSINVPLLEDEMKKRFDGSLVIEHYDKERSQVKIEGDVNDYSIEKLLSLYAESKKIDVEMLLRGYDMVR